jgi:hypothetical protein
MCCFISLSSCLLDFGLAIRHVQRLLYITWTKHNI